MATLGSKALTRVVAASQSGFGTAASMTASVGENMFTDAIGIMDLGVTVDLGETTSVGVRTAIQAGRVVITGKNPVISFSESAASMRTLPIIFDAIGASTTGAGPYTWDWSPTQTDVDTPIFYSLLVGDGVQKYLVTDAIPTEITMSADASGVLMAGATFAASTIASSALAYATALPTQPVLPGRLLKLSTAATFPSKAAVSPTATDYDDVLAFNLSISTGMSMVNALDASLTAATAGFLGSIDATMTITVASNSSATTSFPITSIGTQKFLRLTGVDSNSYGVWILGSWVVENVVPLSAENDGLVVNEVTLRLAYDTTSGKSLRVIVDSPLATAP
jgi:hypothetical protein